MTSDDVEDPLAQERKRRIKFRAAGRTEPLVRRRAIELANLGKPKKDRSEKSRSAWRADTQRDEKIFRFINGLLRKRQPVQVTNSGADTVTKARLLLVGTKHSKIIPSVGLPHWGHASTRLKTLGWAMASWDMNATPFTLHLSEAVILDAEEDPLGFSRHIQNKMGRLLKYRFGTTPGFWFSVEKGPFEDPHLHGAIAIPAGDSAAVRDVLKTAGGKWKSSKRQLSFHPKRGAIGWVGYSTKWMYGTKVRLRDPKTIGASHPVRRAAQAWYQSARRSGFVIYPI